MDLLSTSTNANWKPVVSSSLASKGFAPGEIVINPRTMSSRTAFGPSSSLATAKGTRHPAAIPPDLKAVQAHVRFPGARAGAHGKMLAHAPGHHLPGSPSVSSPRPPWARTDRERLADSHRTRRRTLARWRLRACASMGNWAAFLAVLGTYSDCCASHAQLGFWFWVLGPGLWMAPGCGPRLASKPLAWLRALWAPKSAQAQVPAHPARS